MGRSLFSGPAREIAVALALFAPVPALALEPVDLELVFAADGSGSIDDEELAFQRKGYAEAITHPRVLAAIRGATARSLRSPTSNGAAPRASIPSSTGRGFRTPPRRKPSPSA